MHAYALRSQLGGARGHQLTSRKLVNRGDLARPASIPESVFYSLLARERNHIISVLSGLSVLFYKKVRKILNIKWI
jgi:hypothetical protein